MEAINCDVADIHNGNFRDTGLGPWSDFGMSFCGLVHLEQLEIVIDKWLGPLTAFVVIHNGSDAEHLNNDDGDGH
eukprot:12426106-Karenia_brevis.AAC.1